MALDPLSEHPKNHALGWVASGGLVIYGLGGLGLTAAAHLGLGIVLVTAGAALLGAERQRLANRLLLPLALYGGYLVARTAFGGSEVDLAREVEVEEAWGWARVGLLPAFLFLIWGDRLGRLLPALPWLLALGLFVRVALDLDSALLTELMAGARRATFGESATHFGTWAAAGALLLGLAPPGGRAKRALQVLWVLTLSALVLLVLMSWTRGVWLALAITLLVLVAADRKAAWAHVSGGWPLVVGLALGIALLSAQGWDRYVDRLQDTLSELSVILDEGIAEAPPDSLALRGRIWLTSVDAISQKPWLGWGPGADRPVIENADLPAGERLVHFHNSYLSAVVELGLAGAALLFGPVFYTLALGLHRLWRRAYGNGTALRQGVALVLLLLLSALTDHTLAASKAPYLLGLGMFLIFWGGTRRPGGAFGPPPGAEPAR